MCAAAVTVNSLYIRLLKQTGTNRVHRFKFFMWSLLTDKDIWIVSGSCWSFVYDVINDSIANILQQRKTERHASLFLLQDDLVILPVDLAEAKVAYINMNYPSPGKAYLRLNR